MSQMQQIQSFLPKYVGNPKKTASALIAHVKYDNHIDQYIAVTTDVTTEIPATVSIHTPGSNNNTTTLRMFPDSGASICLGGPNLF